VSEPPRLYVEPDTLAAGKRSLSGDDYHYLVRVLRMGVGSQVVLFDGAGRRANATLARVGPRDALLEVGLVGAVSPRTDPRIWILLPLLKGDRMDWCIQKLVELGTSRILPIRTARCVVELRGQRAQRRLRRWTAIARAAARQSQGEMVPELAPVADLQEAIATAEAAALKLVFWERTRARSLRTALHSQEPPASIAVLVGPEGGLEPEEVDRAITAGFVPMGLGPRVLRAETAAIAAATVLGYALGDIG